MSDKTEPMTFERQIDAALSIRESVMALAQGKDIRPYRKACDELTTAFADISKDDPLDEIERLRAEIAALKDDLASAQFESDVLLNAFMRFAEDELEIPSGGGFSWRQGFGAISREIDILNRVTAALKAKNAKLERAIREVWPHLTGHCLEGATPICFAKMRDAISLAMPRLPYAAPESAIDRLRAELSEAHEIITRFERNERRLTR